MEMEDEKNYEIDTKFEPKHLNLYKQIKCMLWRNYRIKKTKKLYVIVECFWPLLPILGIFILSLFHLMPTKSIMVAQPLFSTGSLMLIQGSFCSKSFHEFLNYSQSETYDGLLPLAEAPIHRYMYIGALTLTNETFRKNFQDSIILINETMFLVNELKYFFNEGKSLSDLFIIDNQEIKRFADNLYLPQSLIKNIFYSEININDLSMKAFKTKLLVCVQTKCLSCDLEPNNIFVSLTNSESSDLKKSLCHLNYASSLLLFYNIVSLKTQNTEEGIIMRKILANAAVLIKSEEWTTVYQNLYDIYNVNDFNSSLAAICTENYLKFASSESHSIINDDQIFYEIKKEIYNNARNNDNNTFICMEKVSDKECTAIGCQYDHTNFFCIYPKILINNKNCFNAAIKVKIFSSYFIKFSLMRFINGIKIYYGPDGPLTKAIFDNLKLYAKPLMITSEVILQYFSFVKNITEGYNDEFLNKISDNTKIFLELLSSLGLIDYSDPKFNWTKNYNYKTLFKKIFFYMEFLNDFSKCLLEKEVFQNFSTFDELSHHAVNGSLGSVISSIWFNNLNEKIQDNWTELTVISYTLRMYMVPATNMFNNNYQRIGELQGSAYYSSAFPFIQDFIDFGIRNIFKEKSIKINRFNKKESEVFSEDNNAETPTSFGLFQIFNYGQCINPKAFLTQLSNILSLYLVISALFSVFMTSNFIVSEKESKLRDFIELQGIHPLAYWISTYINWTLIPLISCIFMTFTLKYSGFMNSTSFLMIYFTLAGYFLSSVSFACALSVFFQKKRLASTSTGFIFCLSYIPRTMIIWFADSFSSSLKTLFNLFPPTAIGIGIRSLLLKEFTIYGQQFGDLADWSSGSDLTFGRSFGMLYIDMLVYIILAFYLDPVFTVDSFRKKSPLYPIYYLVNIMKSMGLRVIKTSDEEVELCKNEVDDKVSSLNNDQDCLIINNLTKKFGDFVAVDGFSLVAKKNEIVGLLGHNGAGKSTIMSMISGIILPTSGSINFVMGRNIGLCPQHDILYDDLSVEDHVKFYSMLRGYSKKEIDIINNRFLEDVGLISFRSRIAKNLSGGMKRKLSIALSFIGSPSVIILDEPTSGIDTISRRSIWDFILTKKQNRSIFLSTHFMDEADILSDKIVILKKGVIKAIGSSHQLKQQYSQGYTLSVIKNSSFNDQSLKIISDKITELFGFAHHYFKNRNEIVFHIPLIENFEAVRNSADDSLESNPKIYIMTKAFALLFKDLEFRSKSIGVDEYGLDSTTLDNVFVSIVDEDSSTGEMKGNDFTSTKNFNGLDMFDKNKEFLNSVDLSASNHSLLSASNVIHSNSSVQLLNPHSDENSFNTKLLSGSWLIFNQFSAINERFFRRTLRDYKMFFIQIFLPVIFMLLAILSFRLEPFGRPQSRLLMKFPNVLPSTNGSLIFSYVNTDRSFVKILNKDISYMIDQISGCWVDPKFCRLYEKSIEKMKPVNTCPFVANGVCVSKYYNEDVDFTDPVYSLFVKYPHEKNGISIEWLSNCSSNNYIRRTFNTYIHKRLGAIEFGNSLGFSPFVDWLIKSNPNSRDFIRNFVWNPNVVKITMFPVLTHSLPALINLATLTSLRYQNLSIKNIDTYSLPLSMNTDDPLSQLKKEAFRGISTSFFAIIAMALAVSGFICNPISDRVSKFYHLQTISGLNYYLYWITIYLWDLIKFSVALMLIFTIFVLFRENCYISYGSLGPTLLLFFSYGASIIPIIYLVSNIFENSTNGEIIFSIVNIIFGVVPTIIIHSISMIIENLEDTLHTVRYALLIIPTFSFGDGLIRIRIQYLKEQTLSYIANGRAIRSSKYMDMDIVGSNITFNIVWILVGWIFIFFFHLRRNIKPKSSCKNYTIIRNNENSVDEDVEECKNYVCFTESFNNDVIVARNLQKVYKSTLSSKKTFYAVDGIYFTVKSGQCFGLLGLNGAGKTTTFKMLTGDTSLTSGDAFICSHNIQTEAHKAFLNVGYCPQFDALDLLLNVPEHIKFILMIKGVPRKYVNQRVSEIISNYDLKICGTRPISNLSCGNRRKLSSAISLMGQTKIIFMDEPSSGMDPAARRFIWKQIKDAIRSNRSVVLTSHSMAECQELCSQVAIMVNGRFRCMGSPVHLKNKYGTGYFLTINLKECEDISNVIKGILASLQNSILLEHVNHRIVVQVVGAVVLSQIFDGLNTTFIDHFSISQMTLEQVFLQMTKYQSDQGSLPSSHQIEINNQHAASVAIA